MAPTDAHSDELLGAVADELSGLHERHYGRRPAATRCPLVDDEVLICVMGGIYTVVEQTLLELQHRPLVHDARGEFQNAMRDRMVRVVERLCRRSVESFVSTHHVGPDLEVEIFVLGPRDGSDIA